MYYLYILKSLKDNGYYIGITSNLKVRLEEHNKGKTKSLKHRLPVIINYQEEYNTKTEARKRELDLKKITRKGKRYLTV